MTKKSRNLTSTSEAAGLQDALLAPTIPRISFTQYAASTRLPSLLPFHYSANPPSCSGTQPLPSTPS
jgi:hypothetical protein